MRLFNRSQIELIEQSAQKNLALSEEEMMEAAGALAAGEIANRFSLELQSGNVGIVVGGGHNGGDGLVVARHLWDRGFRNIKVWTTHPLERELPKKQFLRVTNLKIPCAQWTPQLWSGFKPTLIVDGLFGVGLNRELLHQDQEVIRAVNSKRSTVVALDVPSGLDSDTGVLWGSCIKADLTLSFIGAKPGLYIAEGPKHAGSVKVLPLGVSVPFEASVFLMTSKLARRFLPRRKTQSHKGAHGRLLVIAGAEGTWGAGWLAAQSALRTGTGYVTWTSTDPNFMKKSSPPEVLTVSLDESFDRHSAILIGPGLGVGSLTEKLLRRIQNTFDGPVVADADALTVLGNQFEKKLPQGWVLTPHPGEFLRLVPKEWSLDIETLECDRLLYAQRAAKEWGAVVCLKGFRTILSDGKKTVINSSGNASLAKSGTGDVLAGFIAGFCAQGLSPLKASALGVYLHGLIADRWLSQKKDVLSLQPSDLSDALPQLIGEIRQGIVGL